jgi:hypothetical protein
MSSDVETGPETTSPGFELLRVAALLGIFAGQLYLASRVAKVPPGYCFTRPFWLDEFHTLAVVKEERADQLLLKLSRGGDLNPPGLHLVLWLISKVTSLSDELLLRSFSCAVGLGGLIATYFLLRIRFPWRVSWVAVLGMWSSSPQLIQQMFEGRTYSFWFATVAILCLLLGLRATGIWQVVCVAAVAAMMCSIHYFGIITIGLIIVSQFCCNLRDTRQRWLIGAALASGVITLIAWLPVYFRQRAAIPVPTWIPPPTLGACGAFIEEFSLSYAMTLPILAYALQVLLGRSSGDAPLEDGLEFKIYAGACGLILLPVAIAVFSYVIQPAQMTRYAVPAAMAYAPLIALISRRLNRAVLEGMAVLFFIVGLRGALVVYEIRPDFHDATSIINASSVDRPLIVHWRVVAYPLFRYTGTDPDIVRVSYLFRGNKLSRFDEWEHTIARRMAELFDLPKTIELDELALLSEFYLLVEEGEEQRYVGWKAEPLGRVQGVLRGYRMRRTPGALPPLKT